MLIVKVMSPFSRDYIKRPNKVSAMFQLIYTCTEFTQRLVQISSQDLHDPMAPVNCMLAGYLVWP